MLHFKCDQTIAPTYSTSLQGKIAKKLQAIMNPLASISAQQDWNEQTKMWTPFPSRCVMQLTWVNRACNAAKAHRKGMLKSQTTTPKLQCCMHNIQLFGSLRTTLGIATSISSRQKITSRRLGTDGFWFHFPCLYATGLISSTRDKKYTLYEPWRRKYSLGMHVDNRRNLFT